VSSGEDVWHKIRLEEVSDNCSSGLLGASSGWISFLVGCGGQRAFCGRLIMIPLDQEITADIGAADETWGRVDSSISAHSKLMLPNQGGRSGRLMSCNQDFTNMESFHQRLDSPPLSYCYQLFPAEDVRHPIRTPPYDLSIIYAIKACSFAQPTVNDRKRSPPRGASLLPSSL
jgi:hypothetical protein